MLMEKHLLTYIWYFVRGDLKSSQLKSLPTAFGLKRAVSTRSRGFKPEADSLRLRLSPTQVRSHDCSKFCVIPVESHSPSIATSFQLLLTRGKCIHARVFFCLL